LKLSLDEGEMPKLIRHPALRPVKRGRARTALLSATYFDTPDFRLQREDLSLRVRRVGKRFVQTLKGPPHQGAGAGLHARPEFEWPVRGPGVDLSRVTATPWKKLFAKAAAGAGLVPCFTTEYQRQTIGLGFPDGTVAELCLDRGQIRATRDGRARRAPISEVEMELERGDAANLFRLATELAADLPLAVMIDSKAARGYALRRGVERAAGGPVHATEVTLASDATAADALAVIARECLHQVAANVPGLVTDDDPEWIHQMRVGTRRLRSCLSLMSPFVPGELVDPVIAEVKWLAGILGKARDWDVFVTQTLPPLTAWFARDTNAAPGMRRLRERARRRRQAARRDARAAVASPRLQRLLLAAGLVCATPRSDAHGAPADAIPNTASDPLARAFAARLLVRRHGKFALLADRLGVAGNEERHRARIAAKRLRYAAEFFAPLYPGKRTQAYLETLAAAQDALGQFNDAVTAAALASELSGPADDAAAGAVRGWVAAQASALEPRLAKAVRRFHAARIFWLVQ
jgi:inorganic triphosphatase YgiF